MFLKPKKIYKVKYSCYAIHSTIIEARDASAAIKKFRRLYGICYDVVSIEEIG